MTIEEIEDLPGGSLLQLSNGVVAIKVSGVGKREFSMHSPADPKACPLTINYPGSAELLFDSSPLIGESLSIR